MSINAGAVLCYTYTTVLITTFLKSRHKLYITSGSGPDKKIQGAYLSSMKCKDLLHKGKKKFALFFIATFQHLLTPVVLFLTSQIWKPTSRHAL